MKALHIGSNVSILIGAGILGAVHYNNMHLTDMETFVRFKEVLGFGIMLMFGGLFGLWIFGRDST